MHWFWTKYTVVFSWIMYFWLVMFHLNVLHGNVTFSEKSLTVCCWAQHSIPHHLNLCQPGCENLSLKHHLLPCVTSGFHYKVDALFWVIILCNNPEERGSYRVLPSLRWDWNKTFDSVGTGHVRLMYFSIMQMTLRCTNKCSVPSVCRVKNCPFSLTFYWVHSCLKFKLHS